MLRIIVDAMGGDHAPEAIVNGSIDAVKSQEGFEVLLVGDETKIQSIINERKFSNPRLQVFHAEEVITNEDVPTKAIKGKKKSSMVIAFNMLKAKQGDVFISAGNTGALLTGALLILGRLKGVDRPALGAVVPTKGGKSLIVDAGLNSSCKPINYLQFAMFGSYYMEGLFGRKNPTIGLVNMGTEAKKGTEVLRQAHALLSDSNMNFIGNIEGKDLPLGKVDVAVCDGYVGNVMLKFLEGTGAFFGAFMKGMFKRTIFSKLSMLFVMKDMMAFKKMMDPSEDGGAPILGVDGIVLKSHGNSDAKTIKNVIIKAYNLANSGVFEKIKENLFTVEVKDVPKKEGKRWHIRDRKLRTGKDTQ
ncbi:MAG: phosphate acyltransferase PlsX [Clostridiales bacterium]|nr:phosphate acyltransferase PlsX [Clostridiales bacterium]